MTQPSDESEALRELLRQTQLSGAPRRGLLLHTDRLPPPLAKAHHLRQARAALKPLEAADRAQLFELTRHRCAVVWRPRGESETSEVLHHLESLIASQTSGERPNLGELVSTYELPQQAGWLLDELEEAPAELPAQPSRPLSVQLLAGIEAALAHADLAQFARWRTVMRMGLVAQPHARLPKLETEPAWDERYFAVQALGDSLCPDHGLKIEPWLFRRLSRTLDRRMLAMLATPKDVHTLGMFAIGMNVPTILGADFQRFDDALPPSQRCEVVLNLRLADMLSDPGAFLFARNFIRSRGYRFALVGATLAQLQVLDLAAVGFHYIHVPFTEMVADPNVLTSLFPDGTEVVATGLDRASDMRWAAMRGIALGRGLALAR